MNKLAIPAILVATVMVAGMFAFMPVEQASTVHTQVIAGSVGVACVTQTLTVAGTIDQDQVIFTFSNEGSPIYITSFSGQVTTGGETDEAFGIETRQSVGDEETSVDGFELDLDIDDDNAEAPDNTEREIFDPALFDNGIFVETVLQIIIDDDEVATAIDNTDVITFEICGLVSDPANFDAADVAITQIAGT